MKRLYLRWMVVICVGLVIAWLAGQHYDREVRPITPEALQKTILPLIERLKRA